MWFIVFDVKHGWVLLPSLVVNVSDFHWSISFGVGTGANTTSVLFFCISRNCRMNWMVCSRLVSKILFTTFASTAFLRVGNLDKLPSMVFWTILRRAFSTFSTSFSDMGSSWSIGLGTGLRPFGWCPTRKKTKRYSSKAMKDKETLPSSLYYNKNSNKNNNLYFVPWRIFQ